MPTHGPITRSRTALAALHHLSPAPDQIIVVGDSPASPEDRGILPPGTRLTHVPFRSGPAIARNHGAGLVNCEILLFVDADVVVRPDLIQRIRSLFEDNPTLSAVFGSYDADPGDPGFLSQYRNLLHHYVHQRGSERASTFWAGLGAIRLNAFRAVGGFDTVYVVPSIEDIELGCRLNAAGYTIRLVKDLQAQHLKRWTAASMLRTDLFCRGIPWTRLVLSRQTFTNDLSLDRIARLSTLACAVGLISLVLALRFPMALVATAAALFSLILMNRRFYAFLTRIRGLGFALRAIPWHALFYVICGLAALLGAALHYHARFRGTRSSHA
jgi:GT2 family glycosyltransferase